MYSRYKSFLKYVFKKYFSQWIWIICLNVSFFFFFFIPAAAAESFSSGPSRVKWQPAGKTERLNVSFDKHTFLNWMKSSLFPQSTDQRKHVRILTKSWRHYSKTIKQNNLQSLHKNDNNAFFSIQIVKPLWGY